MRTGKLMAALMIGMVLTSVNSHPAQAKNSAARAAVYEKSRSDEIQKTETQEKETGKIDVYKRQESDMGTGFNPCYDYQCDFGEEKGEGMI